MKKERKEHLLNLFPAVPDSFMSEMDGRLSADNFVIFLADTYSETLFVRCYHRYYNGGIAERQRYVFAKDGYCRYVLHYGKWSIAKEYREPVFVLGYYPYSFDNSYKILNFNAYKQTCLKYSQLDKYNGNLLFEYIRFWYKHPNIEYAVKQGFDIFTERQKAWNTQAKLDVYNWINLKSNNLLKMLGLNRDEYKVLKGNETYYALYCEWYLKEKKYKPEDLLNCAKAFGYEFNFAYNTAKKTAYSVKRIARYLGENNIARYDYRDYLRQCQHLNYDLHDTMICFPHDFNSAHERLSRIIKYESCEKLNKEFAKHISERKQLEFALGDLIIVQPETPEAIIDEGSALHHCVGGYMERHSKGILHIMFIRKRDAPEVPFYTMEISASGEIIQVRGDRNCDMTTKVEELVEAYKCYLSRLEIFKKKEKKSA